MSAKPRAFDIPWIRRLLIGRRRDAPPPDRPNPY
jgi:hypothetical protein